MLYIQAALISILFCMPQQIQESECWDSKQLFIVGSIMDAEIFCSLGDHKCTAGIAAIFDNGIVISNRSLFAVFNLNQQIGNVGIIYDNINFLVFISPSIISYTGSMLIIECRYMLIHGSFYDFAHLHGIREDITIHKNSISDHSISDIDLGAGFENLFATEINGVTQIYKIGALKVVNIALHGIASDTIEFLCYRIDRNDFRRNIAEIQKNSLQFSSIADIIQ